MTLSSNTSNRLRAEQGSAAVDRPQITPTAGAMPAGARST